MTYDGGMVSVLFVGDGQFESLRSNEGADVDGSRLTESSRRVLFCGGGLTPEISDRGVLITLCRPPAGDGALLVSG